MSYPHALMCDWFSSPVVSSCV